MTNKIKIFQYYFFIFLSLGTFLNQPGHATFTSNIFEFEDPLSAKNLHVCLKKDRWGAKEVTAQDIPFYIELFGNPKIMKSFAGGKPYTSETTERILHDSWIPRFHQGKPYGPLKIYEIKTQEDWGHFIAVPKKGEKGVAEIGYIYAEKCWGQGLASSVLNEIIHTWAPEVRRIGQGLGFDTLKYAPIINSFLCEGIPLERLYATVDPVNIGSCKALMGKGFKAATFGLKNTENAIDFTQKDINSYEMLNTELMELFNDPHTSYKVDEWYSLIDHKNEKWTVSKKSDYNKIRFHLEYHIHAESAKL